MKDETNPLTRARLDIHPMAVPRLRTAPRVYFNMEGCLKADAVLSAILDGNRPESVFSVPSVSLWEAEELKDFVLERLRGKRVIIIPDSDWVTNNDVRTQAFRLRETLRSEDYGCMDARVAAPTPEERACKLHGKSGKPAPTGAKRGVDDFLADGHSLDELLEIDRVPPTEEEVVAWIKSRTKRRGPWEEAARERDYPVLRWLTILAREDGTTQVTPHALVAYLGWATNDVDPRSAQKQVNRALLSLRRAGIIESDKSLAMREQGTRNLQRLKRPDLMWKDSPTLTIHPEFRANRPPRLIGPP